MIQNNPSWRNANSIIRYPFVDDDPMLFSDGASIPVSLFVDAIIVSRLDRSWKLQSVLVEAADLIFTFTNGTNLITGISAAPPYVDQVVALTDETGIPSGHVILGLGADLLAFGPVSGSNAAASGSGYITPGVIFVYELDGVLGIQLPTGEIVSGDISLQAGEGVTISVTGDLTAGVIQFNAVGKKPDCSSLSPLPDPILHIAGNTGTASPDANGKIFLSGTDVVRFFVAGSNTLKVKDISAGATI